MATTRSRRRGASKSPAKSSRSKSPAKRSKSPAKRSKSTTKSPARGSPRKRPDVAARHAARRASRGGDDSDGGGGGGGAGSVETANFVDTSIMDTSMFGLLVMGPLIVQLLGYLTSDQTLVDPTTSVFGVLSYLWDCIYNPLTDGSQAIFDMGAFVRASMVWPTLDAAAFLLGFMGLALLLDVGLPGKIEYGPETATGHVPDYKNNALLHCFVFTALFIGCSNAVDFGPVLFDLGVVYDVFPALISCLNIFGILLALFLRYKGLNFPSTADSGSSGSFFKDFTWGTELYPRVFGVDIKRFVNCRFSMTFWMLAGVSFTYKSYQMHGELDYGLMLSAVSQYLYLVKFFEWEIGYMRSIDIIVDRAGFEIQWGCLVWVPAVYTFHSRFLVQRPSGFSPTFAGLIFVIGFSGVALNYWADVQRKKFREANGDMLIWGKEPVYVKAKYVMADPKTGRETTKESLLLASGFWGIARHFHYVFELTAAWSWGVLANPAQNGVLVLLYPFFLTVLLAERAKRDEKKCTKKYGKYYEQYSKKVPYLIVPGLY